MNTKAEEQSNAKVLSSQIVYVRPVAVDDLPQEVRSRVPGIGALYVVHSEDGARLALVKNRQLAFMLARQNDLAPVSVH